MRRLIFKPEYLMDRLHRQYNKVELSRRNTSTADMKGKVLEELMFQFFRQVPGFKVTKDKKTRTEQIDLTIETTNSNIFWQGKSSYFLVECKNEATKTSRSELDSFYRKLKSRRGHAKVGFLVSWNGFSKDLITDLLRSSYEDTVVVLLSKEDIKQAISSGDVDTYLQESFRRAVFL